MKLNRREFLRLTGLIGAGAAVAGACAPAYGHLGGAYEAGADWPGADWATFQALNRLTYGPTPAVLARAMEIGLEGWIEEQLAPESIADRPADLMLRAFEGLEMEANALEAKDRQEVVGQLRAATLIRQVYSRRQLYERMVAFWTDHFNISVDKGDCWFLKVVDDRNVVRAHAFDMFEHLLAASAESPAMLVYLDNQANVAGNPNENYAREVMELHTLGLDGGYSQRDVMELSRCLTGWTVKDHFWKGEFSFKPEIHDQEAKVVLGRTIQPAGKEEAEQVLAMLAKNQATAHHLAEKLVARFLVDEPLEQAPSVVEAVAETFQSSGGDTRAVMRTLLFDGLRLRAGALPPKFKRPVEYVTSALRGLSAQTDGGEPIQRWLEAMGQPPFAWPTPDGPPANSAAWQTSLLPRWQFALELARGEMDGTKLPLNSLTEDLKVKEGEIQIAALSQRLLGRAPSVQLTAAARLVHSEVEGDPDAFGAMAVAGLIASPQFQWR
ncbi:MAG: DUF1800 domain-containing protein [Anaerolineales bacterium]